MYWSVIGANIITVRNLFLNIVIIFAVYAPVPLRPAVLRFIPEPPGSSRFMDRDEPGENDVFCRRGPQDPGASRGTPVHPGRSPAGPRFIPALTQFTPVLGPVLHGSPRSMPAEPR